MIYEFALVFQVRLIASFVVDQFRSMLPFPPPPAPKNKNKNGAFVQWLGAAESWHLQYDCQKQQSAWGVFERIDGC